MTDLACRLGILILWVAIKASRWIIHRRETQDAAEQIDLQDARAALAYLLPTEGITFIYVFFPSWISWANLPLDPPWRGLGAAFGMLGFLLFVWAHLSLGPDFSVFLRPRDEHRLVTEGPYRYVRHPIYSAAFLVATGFFLLSANGLVGLIWLGGALVFFSWRIPREEAMMIVQFSGPYLEYMKSTGCLFPLRRSSVRRRKEGRNSF